MFMNTKNSKTNKQHKLVLNLSQRLDLKIWKSKLVYLLHLKNIRQQYKNNKLKVIALAWK